MDDAVDWYAPLPLFAYGTLRPGLANHERYCFDAGTVAPAVLAARLYRMPDGYPAITLDAEHRVLGELITFPDVRVALQRIDPLEGFGPSGHEGRGVAAQDYQRLRVPVREVGCGVPVVAWCYVAAPAQVVEATAVPGGDWIAFGGRGE